jgi:uncharacterized membrane protein YkvI
MEVLVTLFMASVLCIMTAGAGGIVADKISVPYQMGVLIVATFCVMVFLTGIKGILTLSTFVTPILITGILGVGIYIIVNKDNPVFNASISFNQITHNWFFSSLLYVSYNSIIAVVVMCSLLPYLKTKKIASMGGIVGGITLSLIAIVLNIAIYAFYPDIMSSELPVLGIVDKYSSVLGSVYTYVLLMAMLISAITAGYGFVDRISTKVRISKRLVIIIVCGLTIPLANIGFSGLISNVYPLFGYMGLFMMFAILLQGLNILPSMLPGRIVKKRVNKY